MRMRIVSAAVVLGLGIVGIALAQQAGERPKDQSSDRTKLRAQVIKLRAEIDLLELEHDALKAEVLELMKEIRDNESEGPENVLERTLGIMSVTDRELMKHLPDLMKKEGEKKFTEELMGTIKKTMVEFNAKGERQKKDYVKQAEELAGKRLDLAEVERRYNEAR
jgi:hypothetical protein